MHERPYHPGTYIYHSSNTYYIYIHTFAAASDFFTGDNRAEVGFVGYTYTNAPIFIHLRTYMFTLCRAGASNFDRRPHSRARAANVEFRLWQQVSYQCTYVVCVCVCVCVMLIQALAAGQLSMYICS